VGARCNLCIETVPVFLCVGFVCAETLGYSRGVWIVPLKIGPGIDALIRDAGLG
jgi:hypothetical protein